MLLHGIGQSHLFFSRLARALSARGAVIAFDLPGFGPTRRPRRPVGIEEHAEAVVDELERIGGGGPVVVVGHSMGAQVAVEVARLEPARVSALVLVGPVVDTAHPTLRALTVQLVRDAVLEPPLTQLLVAFDYVRCGIPWFLSQAVAMRDHPTSELIRQVAQPVLVVRGEHDPIAGASWCAELVRLCRAASLVTIAGKRHNVSHSAAASVAAAVIDFAGGS